MPIWLQVLIPAFTSIVGALIGSTGLWTIISKKMNKKTSSDALLMGLAYDRIVERGTMYLDRGYITLQELNDFKKYLYDPYIENGGDGGGEQIMHLIETTLEVRVREDGDKK